MPKSSTTEIIARGVLVHDGRVLLCQNLKRGYTFLPGGHIEFAEGAREALNREMVEECGLGVEVGKLLLTHEEVFQGPKRIHHEINMVFHMEQLGGASTPPPEVKSIEKHIGFVWVDLAELIDVDLRPESMKAWLMSGGGVELDAGPLLSKIPPGLAN
jgi:8-oxo-dGTP diphosphatase